MNIRRAKREKLAMPVDLVSGDMITLIYHEAGQPDRVLVQDTVTEAHTFDEGMIFEGDLDGRAVLGGALIEAEK